jgi:hypothetical protein
MRIISKFYDYYDCVQAHGQDRTIIYNRQTIDIKNSSLYNHNSPLYNLLNDVPTNYIGLSDILKFSPLLNAYQNIFSFISGVLTTKGKTIPEISNEDKIQKSGFDKWSFRKEPTK